MTALRHPSKTLSSALFLFFATLFSTVALGAHLQIETGHRIGLSEYLLMNSVGGVLHSLLGVQPLLVIRPTGPITAIIGKLSTLADSLQLDFFEFLAATGFCVAACMFIIAGTRLSTLARRFTPFTLDIFACFVCSIYVVDGVSDCLARFDQGTMETFGRSLFDLNLALLTFGLSVKLQGAHAWRCLFPAARELLADYAVTIGVVVSTLCSYAVPIAADQVLRIDLPPNPRPTCRLPPATASASSSSSSSFSMAEGGTQACLSPLGYEDTEGAARLTRGWFVDLGSMLAVGWRLWLPALAAAVPISFFFFFDQNISILFSQRTPGGLGRGRFVHSSFVALGILNGLGPWAGLPFLTGSLPHSPQFVRALTVRQGPRDGGDASSGSSGSGGGSSGSGSGGGDSGGGGGSGGGEDGRSDDWHSPPRVRLSLSVGANGVVGGAPSSASSRSGADPAAARPPLGVYVAENRVAPLLVYLLIGLPLLAPRLLLNLPGATIDGVLIFVGYEGIVGTDLFHRALMLVTRKAEFNASFHGLRKRRISLYTAIQLALLGACWLINLSPYGLAVAFLIVALVPLRERLLPRLFSADELARLDAHSDHDAGTDEHSLRGGDANDGEEDAEEEDAKEDAAADVEARRPRDVAAAASQSASLRTMEPALEDEESGPPTQPGGADAAANSRWDPDALTAKFAVRGAPAPAE